MNKPQLEPDRYGRTGCGVGIYNFVSGFRDDAFAYCLDAPAYIPRGSVTAGDPNGANLYLWTTEVREQ